MEFGLNSLENSIVRARLSIKTRCEEGETPSLFREAQLVTLLSPFATLKQGAQPLWQGVLTP